MSLATAEFFHDFIIPAAHSFLPTRMDSPEARAMELAIGFQESGFAHRKQVGGPARGLHQFEERGGINGVLSHRATKPFMDAILPVLVVKPWECYDAIADNDVLDCLFARLLLWTHPLALPKRNEPAIAWDYYRSTWRPGKPHPEVWEGNFARAWNLITAKEKP